MGATEGFMRAEIEKLEKENGKLKEFKAKQEEMMFLIGASIELAHPKTYRDSEKLQKGKEIYEKLYKEELYYLKEENKNLKLTLEQMENTCKDYLNDRDTLREENQNLKEKLSEVTMIADDEKQSIEHILELEEENKKLKKELEKWEKDYREGIIVHCRNG